MKFEPFTPDGEQSDTFEIRSGQTTSSIANFMPVKQGRTSGYVLELVADQFRVVYEDVEATEA